MSRPTIDVPARFYNEVGGPLHSHHHSPASGRVLVWSMVATSVFVLLEVAAGARAHSLALLSDAGHNATDALALVLAWFAVYLQGKPADESRTYGYHRAGVLAAFVNALVLIVLSAWMLYESWLRLMSPGAPNSGVMLWVAVAGIALNGGIMLALHRSGGNDINLRGAFLHMMGDMFGAAAIVVGALAMQATGWTRIDPLLSIAISVLIVWTAWDITRESLNILLEGLPKGLNLHEVISAVRGVEGVQDVHDLHIWSLGSSSHALSCHVLIEDMPPSRSDTILRCVQKVLGGRFHIHHTTIQFEHASCEISGTGCVIPVGSHVGDSHHEEADGGHHHHHHVH
jgi:cobalt-zinc-cadmium efflux system protein